MQTQAVVGGQGKGRGWRTARGQPERRVLLYSRHHIVERGDRKRLSSVDHSESDGLRSQAGAGSAAGERDRASGNAHHPRVADQVRDEHEHILPRPNVAQVAPRVAHRSPFPVRTPQSANPSKSFPTRRAKSHAPQAVLAQHAAGDECGSARRHRAGARAGVRSGCQGDTRSQ